MMACWVVSGALLLVMLTGPSCSYPAKQGFDPSSFYSSSYGVNPASAGSTWAPSSGSGTASKTVLKPVRPQTAPHRDPSYPQPKLQRDPVVSYSSNTVAPVYWAGSTPPSSSQPAFTQDIPWVVSPRPFAGKEASRQSAHRYAPEPPSLSNAHPPAPKFRAGELSQMESSYEHGNYESETEEQGFQLPPPGVKDSSSNPQQSRPGRKWVEYPYEDFEFLAGQSPPGTVTHFSSSFAHGLDQWEDHHYLKYRYPETPSTELFKAFPAQVPQTIKQPYISTDVQSSYLQPGWFEQPHWGSPESGSISGQVDY